MCIFPCFVNRQHMKMRNDNFLKGREREIFRMTGKKKSLTIPGGGGSSGGGVVILEHWPLSKFC